MKLADTRDRVRLKLSVRSAEFILLQFLTARRPRNVRIRLVVCEVQRNEFRAPNNPPPGMPITRWSEQDSAAVPVGLCWPTR